MTTLHDRLDRPITKVHDDRILSEMFARLDQLAVEVLRLELEGQTWIP